MKRVATFLLLGCALLAMPAANAIAGNVYRCDTGDGSTTYSNKRISGASCKLVGSYKSQRTKPRARVATVYPPKAAAMGNATPPATIAGSPVTASIPVTRSTAVAATPAQVASSAGPRLIRGQVYSYVKGGIRNYTSARPKGAAGISGLRTIQYSYMETCYACGAKPGVSFASVRLNTAAYQAEIATAAREYGVDEAIVRAIIHAESAFNPNALSRVGAQGLMQLMPATARRFGVSDAFDASQNISGGVKYLSWLLKRFNGNLTLAAAGYNAGEGAVDKYSGVPPYSETQRYVQRVGLLAERYRGTLAAR
ncbi:lytic transglycosylase domain-containing protein [Thermomonas sp.]|uniref:lytic transglycosylase domain-containing protein n=1 Tax=Thermomonas sp. TaxID=1971895 RepID=UPI002487E852|nr:lytic transglycosylase domain-containing protein [Thermomonas sp.]MDI1252016.1 lytic transglycosylase domain-containing protein [Thermomonas sp.]